MTTYYATERWGVSRGRDTYGYNICTIEVYSALFQGRLISKGQCKGGGYDMAGTSLAEALQAIPEIQERLRKVITPETANYTDLAPNTPYKVNKDSELYGTFQHLSGQVSIDGSTGYSNVQNILEKAGVLVTPNYRGKRNPKRIGWFITISE